ncbi:hypothetical protein E2C01_089343 [Portunus trituberculatus]|uniref:Uncharacterized protein n=1 Tax=Portunus trituberculatus TaxID=210409 RepID=A0A5B7JLZ2_PORTR|nr:hypothetical protein [Portunus trituberculatus]
MRVEQVTGWIMVPLWRSQPWMGMLLHMLIDHPRLLRKSETILTHPCSAGGHPLMGHTQLMAFLLSRSPFESEAYRQRAQIFSWHLGNQVQQNSTGHILEDGQTFVVEGTSIPLLPLCQTS